MKTTLLTCAALAAAICSYETTGLAQAAVAPVAVKPSPSVVSDDGAANLPQAMPAPRASNNATHAAKSNRKSTAKDFPPPLVVQFATSSGEILDGLTEDCTIVVVLAFTVWGKGAEELVLKRLSPLYVVVIVCVPAVNADVLKVATPLDKVAVPMLLP